MKDNIRRRGEEVNIDRVHCSGAAEKAVENTYFRKRNCAPDARDIGKISEHPDLKEAMRE